MKLYRFITGPDESSFCHRVTDALNKGWSLHGSPSLSMNTISGVMQCGQAVTKNVEGKTYTADTKLGEH